MSRIERVGHNWRLVTGEIDLILKEEVDRLPRAGLIRESFYPIWFENLVLVGKLNGKWRPCIDFTYLNKAYRKYSFPLQRIYQWVDATTNMPFLASRILIQVTIKSLCMNLIRRILHLLLIEVFITILVCLLVWLMFGLPTEGKLFWCLKTIFVTSWRSMLMIC